MKKAKHLSERIKQFLTDIDTSNMKEKDKKAVKDETLKFFHNGYGLAEGLDFEKRQPIKALKLIKKQHFKICTSASLLANPC